MITRKQKHNELIRGRAESALADLYHNATVTYPHDLYGRTDDYFQAWFEDTARFEIEYIQDGGSSGSNYAKTLAAPYNAGKYKSERAQRYYVRKGLCDRDRERDDCGALTGWRVIELAAERAQGIFSLGRRLARVYKKPVTALTRHNALWELITDYGTLYTYGRGGRTLAPDTLYCDRGRCKVDPGELAIPACVDLIRIVESFNAYVGAWCKGVPELWREHCEAEDMETRAQQKAERVSKAREARERNTWACRGMVTV